MTATPTKTILAKEQLRAYISRALTLDEDKKAIGEDIKALYQEAKSEGYDTKMIRNMVKLRKMEPDERQEFLALLDLYMGAAGITEERTVYAEIIARYADDLGRENVIEAFKALVPHGGEFIMTFSPGDSLRFFRLDDGKSVVEPYTPPKPPPVDKAAPARGPASVTPLHVVKDSVTAAADRAAGVVDEDLYQKAVAIVRRDQKASASFIQRTFQIGYNRAAQMLERMEADGIVGPADHTGKRQVLPETAPAED